MTTPSVAVPAASAPAGDSSERILRRVLSRKDGLVGVVILAFFIVLAAVPDLLVGPLQTAVTATGGRLQPPSPGYPLGTDELGRSMLNLTVHGARVSMVIGLLATVITVILGGVIGIVGGFVGGRTDGVLSHLTDFFLVLPTFVLALILAPIIADVIGTGSILGIRTTLIVIVVVVGITSWASTARIIRAQALSLKERPFVDRARVIGAGQRHIMARHILPNVVNLIVASSVLVFAGAVLTETTLSFVGLGDPFQPSWGQNPQLRRDGQRARPRRVVVLRPARSLHRARRLRVHARRDGPRRPHQPAPEGTPVSLPIPPSAREGMTPPDLEQDELEEEGTVSEELETTEAAGVPTAAVTTAAERSHRTLPEAGRSRGPAARGRGARTEFQLESGTLQAVDGVSFTLNQGEALGIAGESGCGKTTTALSLVRLLPSNARITDGSIRLYGIDLVKKSDNALRRYRWREVSIVFQGAMNALNPVQTIRTQIAEPIIERLGVSDKTARTRAGELLELVGNPRKRGSAYPHELSGGMRQRAMIAMALACDPAIVIGDEPTTALDVMVQAQILELLERLRSELGLSLVLITHDLSVIAETCDRVLDHVRRPGRGGRFRRRGVPASPAPLHAEAARRVSEHPRRPTDPRRHPGVATGPASSTARVPVRAALRIRDGRLHGRSFRPRRRSTACGLPATSIRRAATASRSRPWSPPLARHRRPISPEPRRDHRLSDPVRT